MKSTIVRIGGLVLLLTLGVVIFASAQGGWQWQNPLPQGNDLLGVDAIDASTIFAVGRYGTSLRTIDAGATWNSMGVTTNTDLSLKSVLFVNSSTGWIVGSLGSIFYTSNGGNDWVARHSPAGARNLNGVASRGGNISFAVGDSGTIIRSTDGGLQWNSLVSPTGADLRSVSFPTANTAYVVGDLGKLLKTADGGDHWFNLGDTSLPVRDYQSVFFINRDTGWAVGSAGSIIGTTNGGASWNRQFSGTAATLLQVTFNTPSAGYAVGGRVIVQTSNGGTTWLPTVLDTVNALRGISFSNLLNGWIVGDNGETKRTTDRGVTWTRLHDDITFDLNSSFFIDIHRGWAAGAEGTIIHTIDGGNSWFRESTPVKNSLRSTFFVSDTKGWAVGDSGTLLATADGIGWTQVPVDSPAALLSIHFPDPLHGWIVGQRGTILRTTNGGGSWLLSLIQTSHPDTALSLSSVFFTDSLTGWITAIYGPNSDTTSILKTTDGGATWFQAAKDSRALLDIQFVTPDTGWAVGKFHRLIKTTNGGTTWRSQITPFRGSQHYVSLTFFDGRNGWVVGTSGTIIHTTNGGDDWVLQSTPTNRLLYGVSFVDRNNGWAVGSNGAILHTIDGGGIIIIPPPPPSTYEVNHVGQSLPNPFLPARTPFALIPFRLKIRSDVTLRIYDALGRLIRAIDAGTYDVGIHDESNGAPGWDGKDSYGTPAPTGVYFYRVGTVEYVETHRLVLIR